MRELPVGFMNDDHRDFAELLERVERQVAEEDSEVIDKALDLLIRHTREHFDREDEAMRAMNHFPPYEVHRGEHERVLKGLNIMLSAWKESHDRDQLKAGLANLWAWFDIHLETMDAVTAQFIARN